MMNHTPTPWFQGHGDISNQHIHSINTKEPDEGIIRCYTWVGRDEAVANAAFIVRACNAHDELLSACKAALPFIVGGEEHSPFGDSLYKTLKEAIAKAEGK